MRLRISARKSDLARLQALMVGEALQAQHPHLNIEYRFKESLGDKNLTDPLWKIPEKGVFTEDFHDELMQQETDLVVHSWKDLPTEPKTETLIAATLPRADQRDLLLLKKSHFAKIKNLKALRIFSSSPRREYNLTDFFKSHLPFALQDVRFENVRGNIPTRIRKLYESTEVDGLIVAKAALDRLLTAPHAEFAEVQGQLRQHLSEMNWAVLPLSINPNAAAQGALAIEILKGRADIEALVKSIHDEDTFVCAQKERDILASFGGGCHQKIGVAVLRRPYGDITFLRGLTDQGQVLKERSLKTSAAFCCTEKNLWSEGAESERTSLPVSPLPVDINALYIARKEAWPEGLSYSGFIWAAGLKTWQSLAQKGIWVHGCAESLGEDEDPRIEVLAGRPLKWAKLSHDEGFVSSTMPLIATYSLKISMAMSTLQNKDSFFWNSGSQFLCAVTNAPEILNKHHACGPGNTAKVIRAYLEKKNVFDPAKFRLVLDQENWRQLCKQ
ncbi:MAG: hydroxymethylbilane synthase [Bdellovibrio sp.]|nr:hydroxymethylbilane synthase [Bdellovibrio sp.]